MSEPIRLFVGFDQVEAVAFHTLVQSVIEHTEHPVSITPVKRSMIPEFRRERDATQSNEFTYSRFLVPYLCGYHGWGLFMDCDMLLTTSIEELWELRDPRYSVMCVKHHYEPKTSRKFLGAPQASYPRKNWSSVMLFNCSACKVLTPRYVEQASPANLHRMQWTMDDQIGELPVEWNHLVGEYPENPEAKNIHWTIGGPWFTEYVNTEHAAKWFSMFERTTHATQLEDLMKEQAAQA